MHRNLEENVRMNNIQREMNERVKKGSRVRGLDLKNRFVNRVAEGPTGAQMYGINAQPYMMNTPTTPINQANIYGSYLNQGLRPEQINAMAYYDTLQSTYGDEGMTPSRSMTGPLSMRNFFNTPAEGFAQTKYGGVTRNVPFADRFNIP